MAGREDGLRAGMRSRLIPRGDDFARGIVHVLVEQGELDVQNWPEEDEKMWCRIEPITVLGALALAVSVIAFVVMVK